MKKVIAVLLVFVMIMGLAACSKKETPSSPENNEVTKAAENNNTEPTKQAEPVATATPEPTKAPEPEATKAPEPTEEPAQDPEDDEFDEFDGPGHDYDGVWVSDNDWVICVEPEGAADIIFVFNEYTDRSTFGSWLEIWTNYSPSEDAFIASGQILHYFNDEPQTDYVEGEERFEIHDGKMLWVSEDMEFTKISDDSSANPYYVGPDYVSPDTGDDYGADFPAEDQQIVDVVATTFYGVYCGHADDPSQAFYYPYYGDEMSMDTMDEFNAAFLDLGVEQDQGQLCFLKMGINNDITWDIEDGSIRVFCGDDQYNGDFYWDSEYQRINLCLHIDVYNVWMTFGQTIPECRAGESDSLTDETALTAIQNYCYASNETLEDIVNSGEHEVWWVVESSDESRIVVLYRSYTGADVRYYIDRASGDTYVTEFVDGITESEQMKDESLNVFEYLN